MSRQDDQSYYSRRAAEEMERGDEAIDPSVASIHYELARSYSFLAAKAGAGPPKLRLVKGAKDQIAA